MSKQIRTKIRRSLRNVVSDLAHGPFQRWLPSNRVAPLAEIKTAYTPLMTFPEAVISPQTLSFGTEADVAKVIEPGYSETSYTIPQVTAYRIQNAKLVMPESLVECEGKIVSESLPHLAYLDSAGFLASYFKRHPRQHLEKAFLMSLSWQKNYHFWLQYAVPRLAVWQTLENRASYPLVISDDSPRYVEESLRAFQDAHPDAEVKRMGRSEVLVDDLILCPGLGTRGLCNPAALTWLRATFQGIPAASGKKRVFLTRRKAVERQILNMEEIQPILEDAGFSVVELQGMPWTEQVSLFKGAEVVVGAHGAGFTNITFCNPGTLVIEVIGGSHLRPAFRCIARDMGLMYGVLPAQSQNAHLSLPKEAVSGLISFTDKCENGCGLIN